MQDINNMLENLTGQPQPKQELPNLPQFPQIPQPKQPKVNTSKLAELDKLEREIQKQKAAELAKHPSKFLGTITKKVCAVEVMKWLNLAKLFSIGAIVGIFVVLLTGFFGLMVQSVIVMVLIVPLAIYLAMVNKEMQRLKMGAGL